MKVIGFLCFILVSLESLVGLGQLNSGIPDQYIKIDTNISVRFQGVPKKYFYQTPMGDVTIFEYKPAEAVPDSNCLYAVALYKISDGKAQNSDQLKFQTELKFNELINSDETGMSSMGGKILMKEEIGSGGYQGIKYKILFSGLDEMNQIEGLKDVLYSVQYIKLNGIVLKMWVYTAPGKENLKIGAFFNGLKISK